MNRRSFFSRLGVMMIAPALIVRAITAPPRNRIVNGDMRIDHNLLRGFDIETCGKHGEPMIQMVMSDGKFAPISTRYPLTKELKLCQDHFYKLYNSDFSIKFST